MAQIHFSHDGSDAPVWTPLPEGSYDFRITGTEQRTSRNDNPTLQVKMEVTGDSPHAGKKANDWYTLIGSSGWKIKGLLDALGVPYEETGKDKDGNTGYAFDDEYLIHRCVQLDATQEEYPVGSGKLQNRFANPRLSDLDEFAGEEAEEAAPEPPAPPAAESAPPSRRRRPRPPAS